MYDIIYLYVWSHIFVWYHVTIATCRICPTVGPTVIAYQYGKSHPILRWLPAKLAAWLSDNTPRAASSGWQGSWMPSWKTTWSQATEAKDSFGHFATFSGSVSATAEGPRHDAIPSTRQATTLGKKTSGTGVSCDMISDMTSYMTSLWYHYDIIMISYMASYMISCCAQDCVALLAPYPNNLVEPFNAKTLLPTRRCPSCTSLRLSPLTPESRQHYAASWSSHALWLSQCIGILFARWRVPAHASGQRARSARPVQLQASVTLWQHRPRSMLCWSQGLRSFSTLTFMLSDWMYLVSWIYVNFYLLCIYIEYTWYITIISCPKKYVQYLQQMD